MLMGHWNRERQLRRDTPWQRKLNATRDGLRLATEPQCFDCSSNLRCGDDPAGFVRVLGGTQQAVQRSAGLVVITRRLLEASCNTLQSALCGLSILAFGFRYFTLLPG